jgi:hypothetical protein
MALLWVEFGQPCSTELYHVFDECADLMLLKKITFMETVLE